MNFKKYFHVAIQNPFTCLYAGFHLLRRYIPFEYKLLNGYSISPDLVTILITNRCNFKCSFCASNSLQESAPRRDELSTQEIKNLIDQLTSFKPSIYFNGGEPFLRKDIFELINYVKQKKMIAALTTNGSMLTAKNIDMLIDSRLDFLSVSIDGPEEYHDNVRGYKGAFRKATEGLKLLVKRRNERKLRIPHIRLASIMSHENIENSRYILQLANDIPVDELAFGNLMFYTPQVVEAQSRFCKKKKTGGNHILGLEVPNDYKFKIDIKRIKKFVKEAPNISRIPIYFAMHNINDTIEDYYSLKYPSIKSRCLSPWYSAVIEPNGDLTPCQGYVVGNIREKRFRTIWNNKKMLKFRQVRKKHQPPACFRCLEGQRIVF